MEIKNTWKRRRRIIETEIKQRLLDYQQHTYSMKGAYIDLMDWFGLTREEAIGHVDSWKLTYWYENKETEL